MEGTVNTPLPPEPVVTFSYSLQYMVTDDPKVDPGDHERNVWYKHAVSVAGATSPDRAMKAALEEFRKIVPYMEWRVVRIEHIEQVMDW
jgi:hypothetical protein